MDPVTIVEADLALPETGAAIRRLIDMYAMDPMGGGHPLPEAVLNDLVPGLQKHPTTHVFLAYVAGEAVGIAVCFLGFSTFAAKPLLNIHDLAVEPEHRGRGVGKALLQAVERAALALGCCKLTLEVLENNQWAMGTYRSFGFGQGAYKPETGGMLFFVKPLERFG